MDITALSGLYYDNAAFSILGSADEPDADSGSSLSLNSSGPSTFERLLATAQQTKRKALVDAVSTESRPTGAAANAGAVDAEHVSKEKASIDRSSPLYEQCRELEGFLLKNLLESMRKTVSKSGLIDTSFASEMYEDMLYDQYAESLSKSASFGLADQAYLELTGQRGRT